MSIYDVCPSTRHTALLLGRLDWLQVNSCGRPSLPRTPVSQPVVASSGESEETTDSGRGSCDDVTGRCAASQRKTVPKIGQTLNPPPHPQSSYSSNNFYFLQSYIDVQNT